MIEIRIICLVIGYALGLFQTGVIYGKLHHFDLRKHGSGNSGMTNSLRTLGWKAGIIVFLGDSLKAVLAIVIVWIAFKDRYPEAVKMFELYAGLGVILGNNFPFYLKFKGGKGIAATVGIVFSTFVYMVPISAVLFFAGVIPTGFISIGSLLICSSYFAQIVVFGQLGILGVGSAFLAETYIIAGIMTAIAFIRHKENIKRLIHGTENKFRPKKNEE